MSNRVTVTGDPVSNNVTVTVSNDRGAQGLSAYAVAVSNGFEGTEPEWLESLEASVTNSNVNAAIEADAEATREALDLTSGNVPELAAEVLTAGTNVSAPRIDVDGPNGTGRILANDLDELRDYELPNASGTLALTSDVEVKADKSRLTWLDVTDYGAVADGKRVDTAVVSGVNVTVAGIDFTNRVDDYVRIEGAGVAGADHISAIATGANGSCTLEDAAPTPIAANGVMFYGTDNTEAEEAASIAAYNSTTCRTVYFPPSASGGYLGNFRARTNVKYVGCFRANQLHGLPNPTNLLDDQILPTVLMPAVSTLPVIYGNGDGDETAYGVHIEGFSIVGSTAKQGYGIKLGESFGTTGEGLFVNIRQCVRHCNFDGFDIGISMSNAVDGEISHCWSNDNNIGFQFWLHDGMLVHNCSSTTTTTTFKIGGCKNFNLLNGNFNLMTNLLYQEDSQVSIGTINVEDCVEDMISMHQDSGFVDLSVDYIKVLRSGNGVLVKNYVPEATKHQQSVRINRVAADTSIYYSSANTTIPRELGGVLHIRQYADNTFAVLNQTLIASRTIYTPYERDFWSKMDEEWINGAGKYGWTVNQITNAAGSAAAYSDPIMLGTVRVASADTVATNVYRFTTTNWIMPPPSGSYWSLRWRFRLGNPTNCKGRLGIWHQTANVKPDYGIGIRFDRATDTTVKLVIIDNSTETVVDTLVPIEDDVANSILGIGSREVELFLQRTNLGISCVIRDVNSVPIKPEVFHASAIGAWSGLFFNPGYYCGVTSTAVAASILFTQMDLFQYPADGYRG